MLYDGRRRAPPLPRAGAAVVRAGQGRSGGSRTWIDETVHALIDAFVDEGRAELNVDFCAAIPVLTITGSFGIPVDQALDIRARARTTRDGIVERRSAPDRRRPARAARRTTSSACSCEAEITDEDGVTHRLSDAEIYSFAMLLLAAGSGTTWKQMGITLAALLQRPELLDAVRDDRALLKRRHRGVGALDADRPDVLPLGHRGHRARRRRSSRRASVLHLCLGAANRDPARWDRPDEYDIRPAA